MKKTEAKIVRAGFAILLNPAFDRFSRKALRKYLGKDTDRVMDKFQEIQRTEKVTPQELFRAAKALKKM